MMFVVMKETTKV